MKFFWYSGGYLGVFFLLVTQSVYAVRPAEVPDQGIIKVIDSLVIDLSKLDSTICIDNQVVLSFDSDSVFACEWINLTTGDTISKAKTVVLSPDTTTQYQINLYYFTGELIKNGDFEDESKAEDRRVTTDYNFGYDWDKTFYGQLDPEGKYRIGKSPRAFHKNFFTFADHTSGRGNMMIVNGSRTNGKVVWKGKVKVEKERVYAFSTWGIEVSYRNPAYFHFEINGRQLGDNFHLDDNGTANVWKQFYELWTADEDEALISLVNLSTAKDGNDFAIDDISFASMERKTGTVTVKVLPAVKLGELDNVEKCEGESIHVNAQASGSDIMGYTWEKDGEMLGITDPVWDVASAGVDDSGEYVCRVKGVCGVREATFRVDVREKLVVGKLRDTLYPCDKENMTLSPGVIKGYNPQYQWKLPGKSLGWENLSSAELKNEEIHWERDTGAYVCQVTSQCGQADVFRVLKAGSKIKIVEHSEDQRVCEGEDVRLYVKSVPEPAYVSWVALGSVAWPHESGLTLNHVGKENNGSYRCLVWDRCNESDDVSILLQVVPAMTYLAVSKDTAVCEGGKAVFRVETDGHKVTYAWRGPSDFRATTAEIVIDPVGMVQTGTYFVTATDSCGNTLSAQVELALIREYDDLQLSGGGMICKDERVKLEISGGTDRLVYDWTSPSGKQASGPIWETTGERGEYVCRISGVCQAVEKKTEVGWKEQLQAEAAETEYTLCPGELVCFSAVASGEEVAYTWWQGENQLGDGATWTISQVQPADAGVYECRIHAGCGDTVLYYHLQVKEELKIVDHTPEKYLRWGETTTLFVNVTGDKERTYSWFSDGKPMLGATANRLEFRAPGEDAMVVFTFVASGCNRVQVDIPVYIRNFHTLERDTVVALCQGNDYSFRAAEKPEGWCGGSTLKMCWVYNGKDTLSYANAFRLAGFTNDRVGDYVYTLESDCGKEVLRLKVDSMRIPEIVAIHNNTGREEEGSIIACRGEEVLLVPETKTYGVVTYEWSKDGVVIPGATESTLTLKEVTPELGGRYSLRVISADCGEDVKAIDLKIYENLKITYVPDQEKCPGESVVLQVRTEASAGSDFVWTGPDQKGWVAESDEFTASYKNRSITPESDGIYECEILNVCGEETAVFHLSVEKEPELPELARHDTICPGAGVMLHIPLEQAGVKYSWTLPDNRVIEEELYEIEHFAIADTGVYHYQVETRNGCFAYGGDVHLAIREGLKLTFVSPDTAVCEGNPVHFQAVAEGKEVQYEWWGPQSLYARQQDVEVDPVTLETTGIYEVVVTDICDKVGKRGKVRLALLKEFEDLMVSRDIGVCPGSDVKLAVSGGMEELTYEWRHNDRVMGHDAVLMLNQVSREQDGNYVCRVSGVCQTVEKSVNVKVFPQLLVQKSDVLPVCAREQAVLTVLATGEQVHYRWLKDGEEVGDRTGELVLNDVIPADAGAYFCEVSSRCGDSTLTYDFDLKEATRILRHAADRYLCRGDVYELFVEAKGENKDYTWTCAGKELPEHENVISRIAGDGVDSLLYTCVVTGDCGTDRAQMIIRIGDYRRLAENRYDTLCQGSNYRYNVLVAPEGTYLGQGFRYRWTFRDQVIQDTIVQDNTISVFSLLDVQPEDAGLYTCEIETLPDAPFEAKTTVELDIDVIRLPEIVSMTPDLYCVEGKRDSIRVVATGDSLRYSWTKDQVQAGDGTSACYFEPVRYEDRGVYEVTVSNACSRVSARTTLEVWKKTVIVYPQERFDSVCLNSNIDLEVLAWGEIGLLYKWYLNGVAVDAPFTQPLSLEHVGREDAGLYLCVVNGRGGADSCKIHLKVLELPGVKIKGDIQLCQYSDINSYTYLAECNEPRMDYQWKIEGGSILSGNYWKEALVSWGDEPVGEIGVEVTSLSTGCKASDAKVVNYYPVPDVYLKVPSFVGYCQDTLKLDKAYPWGGVFTVNGAPADVVRFADKMIDYAVEYFYADPVTGCAAVDQDTIRIAPAPRLMMARDTVWSGWCAPVRIEVLEHSEGGIVWGGKFLPEVTDPLSVVYSAETYTKEVLSFWATLTDSYACQVADTSKVVLLPSPEVRLLPDTVVGVCNTLVLQGQYDIENPQRVAWMPEGEFQVLNENTAELTELRSGEHRYQLEVTDQYGCTGMDSVVVTVKEAPKLQGKEWCAGDSVAVEVSGYAGYTWEDGYEGDRRILKAPGIYHLEVKDSYGCEAEATYEIHTLPSVWLADTFVYEGQKMEFVVEENTAYPPYEIEWQDGSHWKSFTAGKEGHYHVKVVDNIGCTARDSAYLMVKKWYIAAPDAFLPASQGENARFYLKEVNFGSHFEMYIYDRWGELLYKTDEIGFKGGWDGTFKGMHCQPGAYVWVAFVDGKEVARGTMVLVK